MLDRAVANEGEPSNIQISGGEPTVHPQFFESLELAREKPIVHLMVNTKPLPSEGSTLSSLISALNPQRA